MMGESVIPRLTPRPQWCQKINEPIRCLDGVWVVKDSVKGDIYQVEVPLDMTILHRKGLSQQYEYHREINVTGEAAENRVLLRFEGVNGFAWVFIDDVLVGTHENGFLSWNIEITEYTRGKDRIALKVVMDEAADKVSAYNHGGILHSVYLYVLPQAYINALYLSPLFGEDMDNCTLRVDMDIESRENAGTKSCEVELTLYDPEGEEVLTKRVGLTTRVEGYYTIQLPVEHPTLWDAEHPRMYTLIVTLLQDGQAIEKTCARTGLRLLERKGNRVFVNQKEIKLRGVCRHEISPRKGRTLTKELIDQDIVLFKEANCNYIRTSHYPPSEYFLEQCDVHGIYVEDELALAFIARTLPYLQRDPEYTRRYRSHFTECLARDYNHPSVIIWSLCNESFGGYNFDLLNQYVHAKDPTRMTKFSYPMTMQEEHEMPDIWSIHYSEYSADLAKKRDNLSVGYAPGKDMPVLHDEYVHIACYNREELRRDPATRTFWGESIRIFWDKIWNTEGALGGAIWAGIDETDIYDGGNTQLEWGIIDVWRRKKPEFYMTRKAYSPIRVLHLQQTEKGMFVIVENRFCHTNLSQVKVQWSSKSGCGEMMLPCCEPARTVKALIPMDAQVLKGAGDIYLSFLDSNGMQVEEVRYEQSITQEPGSDNAILPWTPIEEKAGFIMREEEAGTLITGNGIIAEFHKDSGLLKGLWAAGEQLLVGGPILNVPYLKLGEWRLKKRSMDTTPEGIVLQLEGGYEGTLDLTWKITLTQTGDLLTEYEIHKLYKNLPKQLKLRVGVDCGGPDELGIAYLTAPTMDTITWRRLVDEDREGAYTYYPQDHIARSRGTAGRFSPGHTWGEAPDIPWSQDMKNDILNGYFDVEYKGSNDFRCTKENVQEAYLYSAEGSVALAVIKGKETAHVRLEVVDPLEHKIADTDSEIHYYGTWYTVEDKKESDHGTEHWCREKGAYAEYYFQGTGIVWYGPQDTIFGKANVYVDGNEAARGISQRVAGVDFSCSSVGYDKKYHLPIFSITGLPMGEHSIRVEAAGEGAEDAHDTYIAIDYFRVITGEKEEPVKLMVNQEFTFPHLSWGNYTRPPITIEEGSTGSIHMKVVALKEDSK